MKFGVEFVPNIKHFELEYYSRIAEENGFENLWITDHYNNRNVYSILTLLAIRTNKLMIGAGVANPYVIHPAVIASAIGTVNEISGRRAVLGIAAGDKVTLSNLGVKWEKPLTRLKEAVEIIRALQEGKKVDYDGTFFKMKGASLGFKCGSCPIYIGAQGPKMLSLAAKLGDGVLINASHPLDFKVAMDNIKKGLKEAGKPIGSGSNFDIAAYASLSIDKDGAKARNSAKVVVAFIVAGSPDIIFERHNLDMEKVEKIKTALNNAFAKGDWPGLHKAVDDEFVDVFSISGTPDEILDRVEELSKVGVTQVVAGSPIGPNKKTSINLLGKDIIPKFLD